MNEKILYVYVVIQCSQKKGVAASLMVAPKKLFLRGPAPKAFPPPPPPSSLVEKGTFFEAYLQTKNNLGGGGGERP